jgi:hypothetical protein
LGGGGATLPFEYLWLNQKVKMPEMTRAMMNAAVSLRDITLHSY